MRSENGGIGRREMMNNSKIEFKTAIDGCAHKCKYFKPAATHFICNDEPYWTMCQCENLNICQTAIDFYKEENYGSDS